MKKLIFLVVLVILFSAGISNAQTDSMQTNTQKRGQFVDKNKDGICDNYTNKAKNNNCCGQGRQYRKGKGNC